MSLNLIDSHCHLDLLDLSLFEAQIDNVIEQAKQNQVSDILSISVDLESLPRLLKTAQDYPNIKASVGLHPCHSPELLTSIDELTRLSHNENIIAIGETGLDYHMNKGSDPLDKNFSWQRERFRIHIQTAIATGKPLIIHTRDARDDTLRILQEEQAEKVGGIMHCFVEDQATAQKALDLGFYISFSGIVTFKSAKALQAVAQTIPDDRLLIETDSPYLAPVPKRGKANQPAYVLYTAQFLAELRGVSIEHIAKITRENYFRLFSDPSL